MAKKSPLRESIKSPSNYSPEILFPIARAENRANLGLGPDLPFDGVDIWNAWELTWLTPRGKPVVAWAEIRVPADSTNIVESKSLKLYLNSLAMTAHESVGAVRDRISRDLGKCTGATVIVRIREGGADEGSTVSVLPGDCIDDADVDCDTWDVDPDLLNADEGNPVRESLHSHLLRSLCPVTSQPDTGSIAIDYAGPRIDRGGLLRYVASYREHNDFHESCVERIFLDIKQRCGASELSIQARYQRRGGIDINPHRSDSKQQAKNLRLWRQ